MRSMREYHRFLRGMVAWSGFRTVILPFKLAARLGGESRYSLKKMVGLSMDAIFSFSLVPLFIAISVGVGFLCLALIEVLYVLSFWVTGNTSRLAPGWSSLMFMLLLVGGSLMVFMGFLGITWATSSRRSNAASILHHPPQTGCPGRGETAAGGR